MGIKDDQLLKRYELLHKPSNEFLWRFRQAKDEFEKRKIANEAFLDLARRVAKDAVCPPSTVPGVVNNCPGAYDMQVLMAPYCVEDAEAGLTIEEQQMGLLDAVKSVRARTGLGLVEAKAFVEQVRAKAK